jgi:hypothetical protein
MIRSTHLQHRADRSEKKGRQERRQQRRSLPSTEPVLQINLEIQPRVEFPDLDNDFFELRRGAIEGFVVSNQNLARLPLRLANA